MTEPCAFVWNGEQMVPIGIRNTKLCEKQFVAGEAYRMEVVHPRSQESHSHYFAAIKAAYDNMPEALANRWRTPDKLRKWALIQAGYCKTVTYTAKSEDEARRMAKWARDIDDECSVERDGVVVLIKTAKSQSYRSMPGKEFADSKESVLNILSALIGVEVAALHKEAKDAAA